MKKYLILLALAALTCLTGSCKKDNGTTGGGLDLTGMWAPVNESLMTDSYWLFENGKFSLMKAEESFVVASDTLWHCQKGQAGFKIVEKSDYRIDKSMLLTGDVKRGIVTSDGEGCITVGSQKLVRFSKFSEKWYASVSCRDEFLDGDSTEAYMRGGVLPEIPNAQVTVSSELKTRVEGTSNSFTIYFSELPPIQEDTDHRIEVSCTGASPCVAYLHRTVSTKIEVEQTLYELAYADTTFVVDYQLTAPKDGDQVEVYMGLDPCEWITPEVVNGTVKLHVAENNSGKERIKTLSLKTTMSSASSSDFVIKQAYSDAYPVFTATSFDTDYKAKKMSVDFKVVNPRHEMEFTASSTQKWIGNIEVKDGKVIFDLEKNTSAARSAQVYLTIKDKKGTVLNKDFFFTVKQDGYLVPVLTVDPLTTTVNDSAQDLRISFNVVNPDDDCVVEASTESTFIRIKETAASYIIASISANEDFKEREGSVIVSYHKKGDVSVVISSKTVSIKQAAHLVPVIKMEPETANVGSEGVEQLLIACSVENPVSRGTLKASTQSSFIHVKSVSNSQIVLSVDANESLDTRDGSVNITYCNMDDATVYSTKTVTIMQAAHIVPVIKMEQSQIITDYTAKSNLEVPYTIENPVTGGTLVVEMENCSWLKYLGTSDSKLRFSVTEYIEHGVSHNQNVLLKYKSPANTVLAEFELIISQTFDVPVITVEEGRTFNVDWQAHDITIHYSVTNPRTGGKFVVEPFAGSNWLSVKSQDENSAVIGVQRRPTGTTQDRTGRFTVRYRVGDDDYNYASLIMTVVQGPSPATPTVSIDDIPTTNYASKTIPVYISVENDSPEHNSTVTLRSNASWVIDDGSAAAWDASKNKYVKTVTVEENPKVTGQREAVITASLILAGDVGPFVGTNTLTQTGDPVVITPKKYLMNDDVMGNYVLYDHLDHSDVKIEFTITNPRTGAYVDLYKGNPIGDSWIRDVSYGRDNVTFSLTKNTDDYKFRMSACTFAYTLDVNRLATYSLAIVQYNRYNGYDYIDLGLPSGKKWAPSCISRQSLNYVNQPDFAYGTPDKLYQPLSFQWASADGYYENYKYSTQVNGETVMTKYCNTPGHPYYDGLTKMLPSDDPAVRYLGGEWHTPSHADLNELFLYCTVSYESYSTMHYMKVVGPNGAVLMLRVDPLQYVSMDHSQMLRFMTSDGPIYEDCSKVYAVLYTYEALDPNKEMRIWMHQVSNRSAAFVVLPVIDR